MPPAPESPAPPFHLRCYEGRYFVFERVAVIGRGRVGATIADRLNQRGLRVVNRPDHQDADLVVFCVPDGAIASESTQITPGPWVTHVSGATPLSALSPHVRRFGVHPLQTFTRSRGAEQLDGAWAAVTAENSEGRVRGRWLAETLGLRPFDLDDRQRTLYHAGAVVASNYLVTLYRAASRLVAAAGAPPEALIPLMRRTIENGFELTGPIARGDRATVDAHLSELESSASDLADMYRALAAVTRP